jgi:hypothetical protein
MNIKIIFNLYTNKKARNFYDESVVKKSSRFYIA